MSSKVLETYQVEIEDVEYLRHDGQPLLARLYLPQGPGPFPLLAEVHGGAWCRGDRLDEDHVNRALAAHGVAVAALDFRMPPQAGYPASLADINYGIRWIKSNAASWGSRADLVSLMGISSGGHQAMLAAMRPDDPRYAAHHLPAGLEPHDARVNRVILCWPVINPLGRYHYALALQTSGKPYPEGIDRVIPDHIKFWGDETTMAEGNPVLALERGEKIETPPVLYIQGDQDLMHPRDQAEQFIAAYTQAGGKLTMSWFAGEADGFVKKKPDSPATAEAVVQVVRFLDIKDGTTPNSSI